ncbi:hypothetical protein SDRG_01736 [Saprolegnia diclina VS20]|uniref:Uncharacterized protein n=1 Tax=Saprolegnia diclina (strain VS20) TaxID=1156394 RepID=T0S6A3_SAPDV|nr:hypothetical protein SDRG_01736 [Saprolegnia diclina VS20]EQC40658.1 hypothetical protein SDRG_01736 [Saprolegnia diclina VS20]|eukprot:XP_008605502.1 hypothetical protein SDRG_01736 [Saprolegnia diclina VS20]
MTESSPLLPPSRPLGRARTWRSYFFFTWVTPLLELGRTRPLDADDLYELKPEYRAINVASRFEECWQQELARPSPSLVRALFRAFGARFLFAGLLRFLRTSLEFVSPFVIKRMIAFLRDDDAPMSSGYVLVAIVFASELAQSFSFRHLAFILCETGLQVTSAIATAVYAKSLKLSTKALQETSTGQIANFVAVDAPRLQRALFNLHTIWVVPYLLVIACTLLYNELGVAFLAGLGVILLVIPITTLLSKIMRRLQSSLLAVKDTRGKLCYEVLAGIKVLKLQAWELSFADRILSLRDAELGILRIYVAIQAAATSLYTGVPSLVAAASLGAYVLLGNELDVSTALTSVALFNVLRFPLFKLPQVLHAVVEAYTSATRLETFLSAPERTPVGPGALRSPGVDMDAANFGDRLRGVSLHVTSPSLVAVIGPVGSGKSTLLHGLLGDVDCIDGHVHRLGAVAYVSQQPFIQNASVRANICFGLAFDAARYADAVYASCLEPDLHVLPHGDLTEIGEKGITLSGGQRTRVALARAMYSDADLLLLDDVLAAVDSHVGADIFQRCVRDRLATKIVLLVTNQLSVLAHCDHLLVLEAGAVVQAGSFADLALQSEGRLASMLAQFQLGAGPVDTPPSTDDEDDPNSDGSSRHDAASNVQEATTYTLPALPPTTASSSLITKEDRAVGHVHRDIYRVWLRACGGVGLGALVVGIFVVAQAMTLGSTLWLAVWSQHAAGNEDGGVYLSVFVGLNLAFVGCLFCRSLAISLLGLRGSRRLFGQLLQALLRAPLAFFDTTPLGRIVNRLSKDVDTADDDLPSAWGSLVATSLTVLSTLATIAYVTPLFGLCLAPIGLLYYRAQQYYIATSRELQRLESTSRSPILALLTETLDGLSTISASGVQDAFRRRLFTALDANQRAALLNFAVACWLGLRLELVGTLVATFAALSAVVAKPSGSTEFAALVGVALSYAFQITRNLNLSVTTLSELETDMVSIERLVAYTQLPPEADLRVTSDSVLPTAWPHAGAVTFTNVHLRYRPGLPLVLRGVSFSIRAREKVGVVGRTGAGKSSLVVALLRLVEVEAGHIEIDGVDLRTLGLHDVRDRIAIIPQDPVLFSGTVRSNLDPFDRFDDDALWTSLKRAHLDTKVTRLDAIVDERGVNFSVGERQLLCIARALLQKAAVLLMDEATASIDAATDAALQETLRNEFGTCTCITIAHRINTILDADRILVLDNGGVAEFDTPANLLATPSGLFSSLVTHWRHGHGDAPVVV